MKTLVMQFRNLKIEVVYQDSIRGIMLSWVGSSTNLIDSISVDERNSIIMAIINQ
jgi:hypothetical protein